MRLFYARCSKYSISIGWHHSFGVSSSPAEDPLMPPGLLASCCCSCRTGLLCVLIGADAGHHWSKASAASCQHEAPFGCCNDRGTLCSFRSCVQAVEGVPQRLAGVASAGGQRARVHLHTGAHWALALQGVGRLPFAAKGMPSRACILRFQTDMHLAACRYLHTCMHASAQVDQLVCAAGDQALIQGAGDPAAGHRGVECGPDLGPAAAVRVCVQ